MRPETNEIDGVFLLVYPYQKEVGTEVALDTPCIVAGELMWSVSNWESTFRFQEHEDFIQGCQFLWLSCYLFYIATKPGTVDELLHSSIDLIMASIQDVSTVPA